MNLKIEKRFHVYVLFLSIIGTWLRYININYSSLWPDELYSVLAVRPGSSLTGMLFSLRALQPPGYFVLLLVWIKIFAYNEFYARLLSVIGGAMAIAVSAYLGKMVKDKSLGILMAIIVAFNPMQIWFSLEARFYIFVYFLAALSILLYWHLRKEKPRSLWLYIIKGVVDASLCYFHHFAIPFVFAQAVFDFLIYRNDNDKVLFLRMSLCYAIAALLYAPWVFWGLAEGLAVKQYWLKTIDVVGFITFNFSYVPVLTYVALGLVMWFAFWSFTQKEILYRVFPVILFIVVLVPLGYSLIRFPILVTRYAMVLGPVLYLMFGHAVLQMVDRLKHLKLAVLAPASICLVVVALSFKGIYMSVIDRKPLMKQPWRQMATWLRNQSDFQQVPIYSFGSYIQNRLDIDFYLGEKKQSIYIDGLVPGKDEKFYLVSSTGPWEIKDSVLNRVDSLYFRKTIPFMETYPSYGKIYVCERKPVTAYSHQIMLK